MNVRLLIRPAALTFASLAFAASAAASAAADSRWTGTWTFDAAKSKLTSYTFSIAARPGGGFAFKDSPAPYSFACDGKATPTGIPGNTIVCKKTGSNAYDLMIATRAKNVDHETMTLGAGGAELTLVDTDFHANGTATTHTETYSRLSSGAGLAGKWKERQGQPPEQTIAFVATPTGIDLAFPGDKLSVHIKLDGTPSPFRGPSLPPKMQMVAKSLDATSFSYLSSINGKSYGEGTFRLANDGKSMTWISWSVGKKNEATTAAYDHH